MRYLVIIMISCFSLFAQTKDSNNVANTLKENKTRWSLAGGVSIYRLETKFVRLTYLNYQKDNFTFPLEFEYFFSKNPNFLLSSTSIRVYQKLIRATNLYYQFGLGVTLPLPVAINNFVFGVNYKDVSIEFRYLFVHNRGTTSKKNTTTFLSISINL